MSIRCLNLLRDHPKRDELLDVLIDAGESAWARGAHEVRLIFSCERVFVNTITILARPPIIYKRT
jgi:hypothetical protein